MAVKKPDERIDIVIDADELGPVLQASESIARGVSSVVFKMIMVEVGNVGRSAVEIRIDLQRADLLARIHEAGLRELQGARVIKTEDEIGGAERVIPVRAGRIVD